LIEWQGYITFPSYQSKKAKVYFEPFITLYNAFCKNTNGENEFDHLDDISLKNPSEQKVENLPLVGFSSPFLQYWV